VTGAGPTSILTEVETVVSPSRPRAPRRALRRPPLPPPRRFPWALLAADALLLHLVPFSGDVWPFAVAVGVLLVAAHLAWWRRRADAVRASRLATRVWGAAVAIGGAGIALAPGVHGPDRSETLIAFYAFFVWASVAMVERRWPGTFALRAILVCVTLWLALAAHLVLAEDPFT
jgi:hypothetical protein